MTKAEMRQHVVELAAGGWRSQLLDLFTIEEIAAIRADAVLLRRKLLAEQAAKKIRGRRKAVKKEPDSQQQLI